MHAAENAIQFGRREGQVEFLQTSFELGRINRATAGCTGELEEGPEMRRREGRWLVRLANGETYELWERREGVLFWERGRNSVVAVVCVVSSEWGRRWKGIYETKSDHYPPTSTPSPSLPPHAHAPLTPTYSESLSNLSNMRFASSALFSAPTNCATAINVLCIAPLTPFGV